MVGRLLKRTATLWRRRGVRLEDPTDSGPSSWDADDLSVLREALEHLRDGRPRVPTLAPEFVYLLAVPPEELHDRFFNGMSMLSLIGILIFTSVLPVALDPLQAPDADGPREANLVDVANVFACGLGVFCGWMAVFTTYFSIQISMCTTPDVIYRAVSQCAKWMLFWEQATLFFVPGVTILIVVRTALASDEWAALVCLFTAIAVSVFCYLRGNRVMEAAFPACAVEWLSLFTPWAARRVAPAAVRLKSALHDRALRNVRAHVPGFHAAAAAPAPDEAGPPPGPSSGPGPGPETSGEPSPPWASLRALVTSALPALPEGRADRFAAAMAADGLSLAVLADVAGQESGLVVAHAAVHDAIQGTGGRAGHALAIARACRVRPVPREA